MTPPAEIEKKKIRRKGRHEIGKNDQDIFKFVLEQDEEGITVLRPLAERDRKVMERILRNRKGIRIGPTLVESQTCPLDTESGIPFKLSLCAIEAEPEDDKKTRKRLGRELWLQGNKTGAEELLRETLEES